ncbi:molybdate ABC transporter substrate-binding protein [Candidatus Halocynthiibacter alkanivorans]|uniref:molybdate ABC transporter substrate-binding protein n=1 Tax=Candidatus Halocynthiibacter alkanivorans TaxID=2267619 RepID=UPI001F474504|nr:molybdate ABC transporter substrate-binding protein [Candidatus Halocynthiibacter alkanivorans]
MTTRTSEFLPHLPQLRRFLAVLAFGIAASVSVPAASARADTVTVFAAASLKTVLDELAVRWAQTSDHQLIASYGSSALLARQIEAGAPADLFVSANSAWADYLEDQQLLQPDSRVDLLSNSLVMIAPAPGAGGKAAPLDVSAGADIRARLGDAPLAMALINAVPAGIYGQAALKSLGSWDQIAGQVAQTDNVRAALALVASGEAPLGLVYATDALAEPRVSVVATLPPESHPPIRYPAALTADSNSQAAAELLRWLQAPVAKAIFQRHGFVTGTITAAPVTTELAEPAAPIAPATAPAPESAQ